MITLENLLRWEEEAERLRLLAKELGHEGLCATAGKVNDAAASWEW